MPVELDRQIVEVDAELYLIVAQTRDGLTLSKLARAEAELVRRLLRDVHAEAAGRIMGRRRARKKGRR